MFTNKQVAIVAVIIVLLSYFVFTFHPELLPTSIWKNKSVRAANRANNKLYEGFMPQDFVVPGAVKSQYSKFTKETHGENAIVVGLHYADWCGYCKLMKPVWHKLKNDMATPNFSGIVFIENDEQASPTPGVDGYPTIYKMRNGKFTKYAGRADYNQLKEFVLNPTN